MSGLSHTPGKRAKGKTFRGFESRLLRQLISGRFHKNAQEFHALGLFYWEIDLSVVSKSIATKSVTI